MTNKNNQLLINLCPGIDPEILDRSGISIEMDTDRIASDLGRPVPAECAGAVRIPYRWIRTDDGWITSDNPAYVRYRMTTPIDRAEKLDGPVDGPKYESPLNSTYRPYIPFGLQRHKSLWELPDVWITEGEKKALALISAGLAALSVPGVSMWHTPGSRNDVIKKTVRTVHPDIAHVCAQKDVTVAYDADLYSNPNVLREAVSLCIGLHPIADQVYIYLPDPDDEKGVDDQIAKWGRDWRSRASNCRYNADPICMINNLVSRGQSWNRKQWIKEIRKCVIWAHAVSLQIKFNLHDWFIQLCEQVRIKITPDECMAYASSTDMRDIDMRHDRRWDTVVSDDGLWGHVIGDHVLPGGTPVLTGSAPMDIAHYIIGSDVDRPWVYRVGSFFRWSGRVWERVGIDTIHAMVASTHGMTISRPGKKVQKLCHAANTVSATIDAMRNILGAASLKMWPSRRAIAFSDYTVMYDGDKMIKKAHHPMYGAEIAYDIDYVGGDITCPQLFNDVLDHVVSIGSGPRKKYMMEGWTSNDIASEEKSKKDTILAWLIRQLLVGPQLDQCALVMIGQRGTGKSTLLECLANIWPAYTRTSIRMTDFGSEYDAARLADAKVNVCHEMPGYPADDVVDRLKSIIECRSPIVARHPYGRGFDFLPTCTHMYAGNEWPSMRDRSGAIWDRILPIRCEADTIRHTSSDDRDMDHKLSAIIPDIVRYLITIAPQYLHVKPEMPRTSRDEISDLSEDADPVGTWIDQNLESSTAYTTSSTDILQAYNMWCEANGMKPVSSRIIGQTMKRKNISGKRTNGPRMWAVNIKNDDVVEF